MALPAHNPNLTLTHPHPSLPPPQALSDPIPRDWSKLFDPRLFSLNTRAVPDVASLYTRLGLPKEILQIIAPQFETPLPPLQPAVFPPIPRDPPPPALELYGGCGAGSGASLCASACGGCVIASRLCCDRVYFA